MRSDHGAPAWGVRGRLTVVTVLLVIVPAGVGAVLMTVLLQVVLSTSLQQRTLQRLAETTVQVASEGYSDVATDALQANGAQRIQVRDAAGRILVDSQPGGPPLPDLRPPPGTTLTAGFGFLTQWTEPIPPAVAAGSVAYGGAQYVVLVAESQDEQHEAVSSMAKLLAAALPILLVGSGTAAWWLVGRALRPVEAIRRRVDSIDAASRSACRGGPTGQDPGT